MYWGRTAHTSSAHPLDCGAAGDTVIDFKSGAFPVHRIWCAVPVAKLRIEAARKRRILSAAERRTKIEDEIRAVRIKRDPALLETLVYHQHPTAIQGSFDPEFLKLPAEADHGHASPSEIFRGSPCGWYARAEVWSRSLNSVLILMVLLGNERVGARFNDVRFFGKRTRKRNWPTACPIWRTSHFRPNSAVSEKTERMIASSSELHAIKYASAPRN
jgi:hypothetical protein